MVKKKRVLYAEDEYTNSRMIQLRLEAIGIDCDIAENGKEALHLYNSRSYDLILMDQYMPVLNGDKVVAEIRSTNPNIPIIAITSDDQQVDNLKNKGCNEVLVKPLRGNTYLDIITTYLECNSTKETPSNNIAEESSGE